MVYVVNAFTLSMLPQDVEKGVIEFRAVSKEKAREILESSSWVSAVGHQSTAEILSELLGITIPMNRQEVRVQKGDVCVVFQLMKRPPEGVVLSKEQILETPHKFFIVRLK